MSSKTVELDVRPLLASGTEPFQHIMEAVDRLEAGQSLRLLAPFKPYPLLQLMDKKGFCSVVRDMGRGDFEVTFTARAPQQIEVSCNAEAIELWPDPSQSEDLSALAVEATESRLNAIIAEREEGEVVFLVIAPQSQALVQRLADKGHQWYGDRDRETGVYRAMIRVGGAAE